MQLQVEGVWFAVDASSVQEILGRKNWIAVPGAARATPGVVEWRGRAVAVLDVAALGSGGSALSPSAPRRRVVVTQVGRNVLAMPVDDVREICEVPEERVRPHHATNHPFSPTEVEIEDGKPLPLLDLSLATQAGAGGGRTES